MNEDESRDHPRPKRKYRSRGFEEALTFFLKDMKRRFPERTTMEIHQAMEQALAEIAPSRDRTRLNRLTIEILRRSDSGNQQADAG